MRNKILNTKLMEHQVALFYIGQEGYILKYQDQYFMIDAYLSDYVDRNCCREDLIWVRNYPAPMSAEELDFVDYVFCTHSHFDHADPDTLSVIAKVNSKAKYIMPAPVADVLKDYGVAEEDIIYARDGEKLTLGNVVVTPIPSAHEELNQDENGDYCEMGYKFEFGDVSIYHAGDCCLYDGLMERLGKVTIMMLPVNGRDYFRLSRDVIGNMTAPEAIELSEKVGAEMMVPMHYDLYDCNCISAASFVDALKVANSKMPFHMFQPGEKYIWG